MSAAKTRKGTLPQLSDLTRERREDPLGALLRESAPAYEAPSAQSTAPPASSALAAVGGITPVPDAEYYLIRGLERGMGKKTYYMDSGVLEAIDDLVFELQGEYRGTDTIPPTLTDVYHAAFWTFLRLWKTDPDYRSTMTKWMLERRVRMEDHRRKSKSKPRKKKKK